MAKKPFDEELNFREDPAFIFDTDPMDLGRYSHEVPTSENTEGMVPDRALSGMKEQSDEEIGAEEMSADDALMAEIAREYAPKEEVLPEIGDRDLASVESPVQDKLSGLLAQYKSMQQPQTTNDSGPNLEAIAAAQKIGQSMAGKYSGNFKPDTEVIRMLQKRRDTKEKFEQDKPSRDLKQLMDMYRLKKLAQGPAAAKKSISKEFTTKDGQPLMTDTAGGIYTLDGQEYAGDVQRYEKPLSDIDLQNLDYKKKSLGLRREEMDFKKAGEKRRVEQFEFKKNETDKMRKEKIIKAFNSDKNVSAANQGIAAADKAEIIINKGGKMAPSVMGRLLARMAGEVGVMTDKDVEAFKGSAQWTDSIDRFFKRGLAGTLTDTDKAEMDNMVTLMREANMNELRNRAGVVSGQFAVANGLEPDQIMPYLDSAISVYEKTDSKKIEPLMTDDKRNRLDELRKKYRK